MAEAQSQRGVRFSAIAPDRTQDMGGFGADDKEGLMDDFGGAAISICYQQPGLPWRIM